MSQAISGLPGTYDRYSSFTLIELERRTATGVGTFSSVFYYYCNAPQNITYNGAAGFDRPAVGAVFIARNFVNPTVVTDGNLGNKSTLALEDMDNLFKTLALNFDMLDWNVRIWEAGVDAAFTPTWIKLKLKGRTEDQTWDVTSSDVFSLDVGSTGAVVDTSAPREVYGATCRFVRSFKGDRCQYAGAATSCDGKFPTCVSYGNQLRYGGFPDAPTPGSTLGVWGGIIVLDNRSQYYPQVR